MRGACLAVALVLAGCGEGTSAFPVTSSPDAPLAPAPDAAAAWVTLMTTDWSLPAGTETYLCLRVTIDHDFIIAGFDPIAPLGTHHSVLTISPFATQPDGVVTCGGLAIEPNIIYGSGVGTQALEMPAGVGVKVTTGQQLMLNLHLFNTSDAPLTGTSGVRVRQLAADAAVHQAEALLAGPLSFQIPVGVSTIDGACTLGTASTIFAVGPHMHKLGVHMTAQIGATPLLDRDYTFDAQTFTPVAVQAQAGDRITTACTYANDTGAPVHFGQSTNDEMCFLIVYRYPAGNFFDVCSR